VKKETNQTLGEKETNQTLGEKRDKDKHLMKKEKKINTW
jgi:hypothetical protein